MKDNVKLGDKTEKMHLVFYFKKDFTLSLGYQFIFLNPGTFSFLNIYLRTVI